MTASRALNELNFMALNGRAIRVMYSVRDPSLRKSGVGNIFIKVLILNLYSYCPNLNVYTMLERNLCIISKFVFLLMSYLTWFIICVSES